MQPDLSNWPDYKGFRSTHYKSHNVQKRFEQKEKNTAGTSNFLKRKHDIFGLPQATFTI